MRGAAARSCPSFPPVSTTIVLFACEDGRGRRTDEGGARRGRALREGRPLRDLPVVTRGKPCVVLCCVVLCCVG